MPLNHTNTNAVRIRGPTILRRLVEQLRLARVLTRVEQASSSLLPETRLLGVARPHVSPHGHGNHISHQRTRTRTGHGLHHAQVSRLRLHCHDVADADCHGPALQVGQGPDSFEQCALLVLHDPWIVNGKWKSAHCGGSSADREQMCALYVLV
jgi:hypothetical protein